MARIITKRAEQKRRREIMAAAMDRARASRLAHEARGAVSTQNTAPGASSHINGSRPMPASETKIVAWIREHGDANTMSLVSNDEVSAGGKPVHVVKCGACRTEIRVHNFKQLLDHVDASTHVAALASGRAPEHPIDAWIREHGGSNSMTVISNNEVGSTGKPIYTVSCRTCRTEIRATGVNHLLDHVDSAKHVAALESGRAPETKIVAWIHEQGGANTMSLVSKDEMTARGQPVYVVKCGACRKEIRAYQLKHLLNHVDSAAHVAAGARHMAALDSKTELPALRKRPRC
jgi:hypothetical protein